MNKNKEFVDRPWRTPAEGLERGAHITRYYMYNQLKSLHSQFTAKTGKVLAISDSRALIKLLGLEDCEIITANYPVHNILDLSFTDSYFDYVLSILKAHIFYFY